ncbi:ComEC/Rec2 family competence protein [Celeribacter litoreus]|uniref:ComEC/Rec2 family competence protein n=1 Tax=Celeribacter litoreus TaxID=2876714 RepID=UPI001CCEDA6F|nr:ComEC/Rec2 family competence protein [Celeribacter litoreus]MCA0044584.1 ComEC family competence protein [Celeribacter litoreus]
MDAQRGRLFLWLPVLFALGVGLFFAAPLEPGRGLIAPLCVFSIVGLILLMRIPPQARPLVIAVLTVTLGFLNASLRTHMVAEPVLGFRYYGPVEGRVIKIDRSASRALRLTLDRVTLSDTTPERTPARVRISLHGDAASFVTPEPGQRYAMTANLSPPPGPAEPGGFDFRRMAWFDRLGAVGYTRTPVLLASEQTASAAFWVHKLRQSLSSTLQTRLEGQVGAFAAAVLTGDRSGVSAETAENLRGANLSHLLAISGLHMGLLTGSVFFALRLLLALIPGAALKWPIKKFAAVGALLAGGFYLALSGFAVSTERAYVMVCVMLIAVLFDVQALTLRAVALAALLLLAITPEILPEPGFQMSFAATTALVAVFALVRRHNIMRSWPRPARAVATVVLSSAVAGLATAPVAAAHFNRIAEYGLIANVVSVPLMGLLVMPAAILAVVLTPLGLQGVALTMMGWGIRWILWVAETVSGWDGAVRYIQTPPSLVLPIIAIGALFILLWRGRAQYVGAIPVLCGAWLWAVADRPALLVSEDGGLVGRMTIEGRALSKPKGSGFAAMVWLENDGDFADQATAATRKVSTLDVDGLSVRNVTGRGWHDAVLRDCAEADVVIVNQTWEGPDAGPCLLLDQRFMRVSGSLAFWRTGDAVELVTATGASGVRLWNSNALRRAKGASAEQVRADLIAGSLGLHFPHDEAGQDVPNGYAMILQK